MFHTKLSLYLELSDNYKSAVRIFISGYHYYANVKDYIIPAIQF